MDANPLASAIAQADAELVVEIADNNSTRLEAYRLRHQVYCLERGFEAGIGDYETDNFDRTACHILLRRRSCGQVIGTSRLIMPRANEPDASFPMQGVCPPSVLGGLPACGTSEVSRFAVSKVRRGLSDAATSMARLALVRGLVELSRREGVTHWCAMMERTLLRLLRATSIHFIALGEPVEYHGLRQPAYCQLDAMLQRMRREQVTVWRYITADGAFAGGVLEAVAA